MMHVNILKKKAASEKKLSMHEKKHLANLRKNNGLYFQIGLILSLFMVFGVFQLEFEKKALAYQALEVTEEPLENVKYQDYVIEEYVPEEVVSESTTETQRPEGFTSFQEVENHKEVKETLLNTDPPKVIDDSPAVADIQVIEGDDSLEPIVLSLVQELPVFPGCEKYLEKKEQLSCFSKKITRHINKKFDTNIASEYGFTGHQRVNVSFVINTNGEIEKVEARAPHPALQQEAIKAIQSLPKMKPAQQGYKKVPVKYALPISFQVN